MKKSGFALWLLWAWVLVMPALAFAGARQTDDGRDRSSLSLYFENDLFTGTDQEYTNGVRLTLLSADVDSYDVPDWAKPVVDKLPFIHRPGGVRNLGLSLGQNMFTPDDISTKDPLVDQRPYAGWFYGAVSFHSKTDKLLDVLELELGMIGQLSLAGDTQKFIHQVKGVQRPIGWHHQLKNEPGLAVIYERKWRLRPLMRTGCLGLDFIPHAGASLGNVAAYANLGGQARFGFNLPYDFGTEPIRPTGDTNSPFNPLGINTGCPFGAHVFTGVDGRFVARNIFLDGNTFVESHSVDRENWVADFSGGVGLNWGPVKVTYSIVLRTREYVTQKDRQLFGSVTVTGYF